MREATASELGAPEARELPVSTGSQVAESGAGKPECGGGNPTCTSSQGTGSSSLSVSGGGLLLELLRTQGGLLPLSALPVLALLEVEHDGVTPLLLSLVVLLLLLRHTCTADTPSRETLGNVRADMLSGLGNCPR